ncbi:MAG TPA: CinA family protein, partial [Firmicutes bacterium]|nr:CinA family protein [Bacillota bacterium]
MQRRKGHPTGKVGIRTDKDLTNAEKVIFTLKARNQTISCAESCTAGGFGYALTRVPGSSIVFKGGVITYTRETKSLLLKLDDGLMDSGLVSPEITLEMAKAVLRLFDTDYSAGVTGNAGPTTDTGGAGVGRVYWAVVDKSGRNIVKTFDLFGNRDD